MENRWGTVLTPAPIAAAAAAAVGAGALAAATTASASASVARPADQQGAIKHVLLISVEGLHQQDLAWYVKTYPNSVLASLYGHGLEYSSAMTPFPSDSSPGMTAQVTGHHPPKQHQARRVLHRRRHAALAVGPIADGRRIRAEPPA